jgi:hypothetical protein
MAAGVLHACALREALAARPTAPDTERGTCSGSANSSSSSNDAREADGGTGVSSTNSNSSDSDDRSGGLYAAFGSNSSYRGDFNHAIAASHARAIAVASPLGLSATLAAAGWNLQTAAFVDTACATSVVVPNTSETATEQRIQ